MTRPVKKVERILSRDGGCCVYCDAPLVLTTVRLDHVIPRVAGGPHDDENMAASCERCNALKGCLSVEEFHDKADTRAVRAQNAFGFHKTSMRAALRDYKYFSRICFKIGGGDVR